MASEVIDHSFGDDSVQVFVIWVTGLGCVHAELVHDTNPQLFVRKVVQEEFSELVNELTIIFL
jgi:hypothetical protein